MSEEIDVSGCEHRRDIHKSLLADGAIKEFYNYCYISNDGCYGINCYYKQLQQLKQENKELKIFIESNRQQVEHSEMLIYDNDYLQQKLEKINKIAKENCSCTRCEDFNCCDGCQDENYRRILKIIESEE